MAVQSTRRPRPPFKMIKIYCFHIICVQIINYASSNVICLALNEPKTIWEEAAVARFKELFCASPYNYRGN
jgi:hypothetical protein